MVSKYFKIHELVPRKIYNSYKEKAWKFINPSLISTLDSLKEHFPDGTITINNYVWGGNRQWSGWRLPESDNYSETSQHSLGNAADCVFSSYNVEDVRKFIIDNPKLFPYVKGIELGVSWLHIDVRNTEHLIKFNKKGS